MRVALLHFRENYTPAPPMGILYLGTVLKKAGFTVKVIDSFPRYHKSTLSTLREFKPDLIGLSVLTTGYRVASIYTALIRQEHSHAMLCWGGVHASSLPREVLQEQPIDFVVVGEGEVTLKEACLRMESKNDLEGVKGVMFKRDNRIIDNGPRGLIQNLDTLPIPDRALLETPNFSWYLTPPGIIRGQFLEGITTFYTSRGCPFNCIFCCSHNTAGRIFRQRSVANVLEEITYLVKDFKVKGLYVNDDTFAINKEWLFDFCNGLRKKKFKLVWGCQTRANLISREICLAMKEAGCIQVDIGAESGSEKVLRILRKDITPEDTLRAFRMAQGAGLKTFATFILGTPGETALDIKKTELLAKKIKSRSSFLILVPYPGSEIYKMAKANNWFCDAKLNFSENWANKQSEVPIMAVNLRAGELLAIRAKLQNIFFARNNLEIIFSFFIKPIYFLRMLAVFIKNPKIIMNALIECVLQQKASLFLEGIYQQFNAEVMAALFTPLHPESSSLQAGEEC